jgi:hypothetical protein
LKVRNEVAPADAVVWLGGIGRHLGGAGAFGFREGGLVHSHDRNTPCVTCAHGQYAPIHNIRFPDNSHSDAFFDPRHIVGHWLPFLLGYEVHDYQAFVQYCRLVMEQPTAGRNRQLVPGFCRHQSVWRAEAVADRIIREVREQWLRPRARVTHALVLEIALELALVVITASAELDAEAPNSNTLRCLEPDIAVEVATQRVLARHGFALPLGAKR